MALLLHVISIEQSFAQVKLTTISVGSDFLPASRYIRPKDSVKTHSKTIHNRFSAELGFSLFRKIDTNTGKVRFLTANLRGNYTAFKNKDYSAIIFPEKLLASDLGFQYYTSLKKRWAFIAFLSAGIYSDLEAVSANDVFATAGGIFIKKFRPNLSVGFGLIVNNSLGSLLVWPALSVDWQLGKKYKLNINVPDNGLGLAYNIGLTYPAGKHHELTLAFRPRQLTYDVENNPTNRLMSYWELPVGLQSRWRFSGLSFFASGGLMALRSVQFGEKKLSKMFHHYPAHRLAANFYLGAGIQVKL